MRFLRRYGGWFPVAALCAYIGWVAWQHRVLGYGALAINTIIHGQDGRPHQIFIKARDLSVRQPEVRWPFTWLDRLAAQGRYRPGPLELRTSFDQFESALSTTVITKDVTNVLDVVLIPKPKTMTIRGLPPHHRAKVSLLEGSDKIQITQQDGGATHIVHPTRIGDPYRFEASADQHRPRVFTLINTNPFGDLAATVDLERQAGAIVIDLAMGGNLDRASADTMLAEAKVSLDGTPARLREPIAALATNLTVVALHPDCFPAELSVAVTDRVTNRVALTLLPRPAKVVFSVPDGVPYEVIDAQSRTLTVTSNTLELHHGTHRIGWRAAGFEPTNLTFALRPNTRHEWKVHLVETGLRDRQAAVRRVNALLPSVMVELLDQHAATEWGTLKASIAGAIDPKLAHREALSLLQQAEAELPAIIKRAQDHRRLQMDRSELESQVGNSSTFLEIVTGRKALDAFESRYGVDPATKTWRNRLLENEIAAYHQSVRQFIGTNAFRHAWTQAQAASQAVSPGLGRSLQLSVLLARSNEVLRLSAKQEFSAAWALIEGTRDIIPSNELEQMLKKDETDHARQNAQAQILAQLAEGKAELARDASKVYMKTFGSLASVDSYQTTLREHFLSEIGDAKRRKDKGAANRAVRDYTEFGGNANGKKRLQEVVDDWPRTIKKPNAPPW